jgi:short-subunit dehydrogenase
MVGIGAGVAAAFAKYAPKDNNAPHIILIGRSQQGADSVIEEMKRVNAGGKYEFVQGDLTMMKNVRSISEEIASRVDKINYLCMSPGVLTFKSKDDTEEGIDRKMALHFYSRYGTSRLTDLDS